MPVDTIPNTPRHDLDFFDGQPGDDGWPAWLDQMATALGVLVACRPGITVRAAADVFHVTDAVITKAVAEHGWLFLSGPADDPTQQTIEEDGE